MIEKDHLDAMIESTTEALALPLDPAWVPAVRANLDVSLRLGKLVAEFGLPDEAEPAPVFRA